MAFPAPTAVFLDENLQIHRGKRIDAPGTKPLKPSAKPGLQERKALQDVSNMKPGVQERKALRDVSNMKPGHQERKALQNVSNISKGTVLKERPQSHEAIKNHRNKTVIFADKENTKCHEWAKDGVEGTHFTGSDSQKLDKNAQDNRIKKKVEKVKGQVKSALHDWTDVVFDHVMFPATEVAKFSEEVKELELEPEILPDISRRISYSGDKAKMAEDFTDDELDWYPFLDDRPVEFQLRDEPAFPALGVN